MFLFLGSLGAIKRNIMRILVILAHPTPGSMNSRLSRTSHQSLMKMGHEVLITDLYGQGFRADASPYDFKELSAPDYFDLQKEQRYAIEHDNFVEEIKSEQQKLLWADALIFHFPFWWYSMPAILKGYFDRVFSVGFAYGGTYKLAEKKALACITTGAGPDWLNENQPPGSLEQILHHIYFGTFEFCKMEVLEPFYVYKAKHLAEPERQEKLKDWQEHLEKYFK